MKEIFIPFKPEFYSLILNGTKVVTRRYKKYGEVGDYFVVCGKRFILSTVYKEKLSRMNDEESVKEGCKNLDEFKFLWRIIHPQRGFQKDDKVFVHRWD